MTAGRDQARHHPATQPPLKLRQTKSWVIEITRRQGSRIKLFAPPSGASVLGLTCSPRIDVRLRRYEVGYGTLITFCGFTPTLLNSSKSAAALDNNLVLEQNCSLSWLLSANA